jgi:DNA mismatch endonuclease (patch repair protein)
LKWIPKLIGPKEINTLDIYSEQKRSEIMSHVKAANSKPEIIVRRLLHRLGYRFRLHRKDLPGKPDIVMPKYKIAIFVHGCFWHHHENCKKSKMPTSNIEFWHEKIMANVVRDKQCIQALGEVGWKVMVIWECEVSSPELPEHLETFLRDNNGNK